MQRLAARHRFFQQGPLQAVTPVLSNFRVSVRKSPLQHHAFLVAGQEQGADPVDGQDGPELFPYKPQRAVQITAALDPVDEAEQCVQTDGQLVERVGHPADLVIAGYRNLMTEVAAGDLAKTVYGPLQGAQHGGVKPDDDGEGDDQGQEQDDAVNDGDLPNPLHHQALILREYGVGRLFQRSPAVDDVLGGVLEARLSRVVAQGIRELFTEFGPGFLKLAHGATSVVVKQGLYCPAQSGQLRREATVHEGVRDLVEGGHVCHEIAVVKPHIAVVGRVVAGRVLQIIDALQVEPLRRVLQFACQVEDGGIALALLELPEGENNRPGHQEQEQKQSRSNLESEGMQKAGRHDDWIP